MEQSVKKPSYIKTLLIGFVSVLSAPFPFLLAAAPGFFAYLLYTGGVQRFGIAFLASCAGSVLLFGPGGLYAQLMILAVSLLICMRMRKRGAYFDIALFSAAAITLALYLSVSMEDILTAAPAFHTIQTMFRQTWQQTIDMANALPGAFSQAQLRAFESQGSAFAALLPIYMPAALCSMGALFGLCNVLITVKLNRRAHAPMKPMSKFIFWRLPKSFAMGALVMAAGILVAALAGVSALDAAIPAVVTVVGLPLVVQGISLYAFFMRMRRLKGMFLAALILLCVFVPSSALFALAIAGLMEQLLHIRRRILQSGSGRSE